MSSNGESVWSILSKCGVCEKSISSMARLMPCCHSAHNECIDDELAAIQDLINTNINDRSLSKCKICSQEFSPIDCIKNSFQSIYLRKNAKNGSEESQKICQSCDGQQKSAIIKCQSCDWICLDCYNSHIKMKKVFSEHIIDEKTRIEESIAINDNICSEHNELITVYCKTCKSAYCARCILKDHNLHIYEDTKDTEQMKLFYDHFTKQVDRIKEKRSFTVNTLQKFESIESEVSDQKNKCIDKIKSITQRLQEKISELGKTMLDKVNTVCQQKETEFSAKKSELNELNYSFKYIENFMSAIMELNDPMAVMEAQELLNKQLEKLLNQPCSHPDFVKPFEIDVIDELQDNSKGFSVGKMIDGVFNMCFKLRTSDDPKENSIEPNVRPINETNEEEIVEITPISIPISTTAQTITISHNTSRGNRDLQIFNNQNNNNNNNNNRKSLQTNSYANNYNMNNFQNANNSNNTLRPQCIADTQRLQNKRTHSMQNSLQSLNAMTNSVTNTMQQMPNNFSQTGIAPIPVVTTSVPNMSYGCPQVYRGPPLNPISSTTILIPPPNMQNYTNNRMQTPVQYSNPPNVTIRNPNTYTIAPNRVQQIPVPIQPQTQFNHNMRTIDGLAGGTITARIHQKSPSYHSTPQQRLQLPQQRLQQQPLQPQTTAISPSINSNSRLSYQLTTPAITCANQRTTDTELQVQQKINQIKELTQQRIQTQSQQLSNTRLSNALPNGQQIATNIVNNSLPNSPYHLHIADQPLVRPQPQQSPQIQTSVTNIESLENRRNSAQSNSSPVITQSNEANDRNISNNTITTANTNKPVVDHISRTQSTETAVPTTPKSMPVISQMFEEMPLNEEQNDESSKCAESISDTTSPDSGISTANTALSSNSNEKSADIRDENKENKIVARIAPITPEFDSSDQTNDEMDDDIEEDGFCVVCRKEYGEFLCCERCPRAFHIDCHVPELKKMPDTSFVCTFCKNISQIQTNGIRRGKNKTGLNEKQQAICERILIELFCNTLSEHFKHPFSQTIPNNNLDLNTVKKKLEDNKYDSEEPFIKEIRQIFHNYKKRNHIAPQVLDNYRKFEHFFNQLLREFLPDFIRNNDNNSRDSTTPTATKRSRLA